MSNEVTLNASIRTNLNSLQNTAKLMETTSSRLSTGKKVSSALDGPSAFFQAQGLTNRANDLLARKDNIGVAVSAIKSADKSLTAMTKLVEQAKALATQAQEASAQVTTISSADISAGSTDLGANIATITDADTFTIQVGDATAVTITIADGDGITELVAKLDAADSGINAVYNNTTGKIDITADAGTTVTFADGTGTPLVDSSLFAVGATTFGSTGSGSDIATLEADFKEVMDQIDTLRTDALYKGINLLNGDTLTVKFNEDASSKLDIAGVTYNYTGLGFTTKASVDWTTSGDIDTSLTEADTALSSIRSQQSKFGTNLSIVNTRLDFTTDMVNALNEGASKLVDADMEAESANLLALQTRQALGIQSLSMANQSAQSILSLFR